MSPPRPAPSRNWLDWPAPWMGVLIFFATLVAYGPALNGTLLWDDAGHVTRSDLRSLGGLARIWFEIGATQQYYPLLHSAFWFEHRIWGDATLGYHLVNVFLHATSACLFALILRTLAVPGAWLAAVLFALHPVCVESVAWISEQKNTLSAALGLAAVLVYLRFDDSRRRTDFVLATVLFALALLAKTVVATIAPALLVLVWWRRGRLEGRRDVAPLLPWFGLGAGLGLLTVWFEQAQIGASGSDFDYSLLQRGLLAGRVIWFYIGKLLWPAELVFIYPRWSVDASALWQWLFPLATVALGLLLWLKRQRALLVALLVFVVSLFPVLGFVNVYPFVFSFVADHFQYLACLAIIAPIAAGLTLLSARLPRAADLAVTALLLAILATLTWQQCGMYRDVFALYETTLTKNPACWMAHNNLALALGAAGRVNEAIPHLEQALTLRPQFPEAENNLGHDLTVLGRFDEAIRHLERALKQQPRFADAHSNLGVALMSIGRGDEGMAQFREALRDNPDFPVAHFNLGLALARNNRVPQAIVEFTAAVRLNPDYGEAELNWAIGLALTDHVPEAVPHFERAIELQPDSPEPQVGYGRVLARIGRVDEAIAHFERALSIDPNHADAHLNLAFSLRQVGRSDDANVHYAEAQRLKSRRTPEIK